MSNFDKNFEAHKSGFRQKFGIEWTANHALYLQYLQLQYTATITELSNTGLLRILDDNKEIKELLKGLHKK